MRVDHGRGATKASCSLLSQTLPEASTFGTPI
jgi:hypothetical protein